MFKGFKFDDPAFQAHSDSFGFNDEVVFAILTKLYHRYNQQHQSQPEELNHQI